MRTNKEIINETHDWLIQNWEESAEVLSLNQVLNLMELARNEDKNISSNSEKKKTIYDLKLHDSLITSFGVCILRVPGGWLYNCWNIEKDEFKNGVFIPFNNVFLTKE